MKPELTPREAQTLERLIRNGGRDWAGGGSSPTENALKAKGYITIIRFGACCDYIEVVPDDPA